MSYCTLNIRLTSGQKKWLEYHATRDGRSENAQIRHVIEQAMKADPLNIVVHECEFAGRPRYYTVSIGKQGRDFFETEDRQLAINKARDKAEELDLGRSAIAFERETNQ